ncbi:thiamine phosphate synthase [Desulforudis sp. DRI-14]|uniref:thiamine phosphate synthase n=1 Tax=Desulforudis sp. DRI-14 TaxID=3459793 RepID=UPI00404110AB
MVSVFEWARIADVNFNRAREGLRVAEETARFVFNDRELTLRVKDLRHRLSELEARFPGGRRSLLLARDAAGDCTASEVEERPRRDLAGPNWKRVQEAVRVLEELARTFDGELAHALKEIRFKAYTLEKEFAAEARRAALSRPGLYVIGGRADTGGRSLLEAVREAVRGGAHIYQLREKEAPAGEILPLARELRKLTAEMGLLFIVNDRLDIALACGADGVHLGQDDLPLADARQVAGPGFIIGVSTHSLEQALAAEEGGADYIGVGPVYPTATKPEYRAVGLDLVRTVARRVSIPFVAIGGIDAASARAVVRSGARQLAVVRACFGAADIAAATGKLCAIIEEEFLNVARTEGRQNRHDPDAPGPSRQDHPRDGKGGGRRAGRR